MSDNVSGHVNKARIVINLESNLRGKFVFKFNNFILISYLGTTNCMIDRTSKFKLNKLRIRIIGISQF